MGWANQEDINKASEGGAFIKLERHDQFAIVAFLSDRPTAVYKAAYGVDTPKSKADLRMVFRIPVALLAEGDGTSIRVEHKEPTLVTFEDSASRFKDLGALDDEKPLAGHAIKWKRNGAKGDKETKYLALHMRELTPAENAWIANMRAQGKIPGEAELRVGTYTPDAVKIEAPTSPGAVTSGSASTQAPSVDVAAGHRRIYEVLGKFRESHKDEIGAFVHRWGVTQVSQIGANHIEAAVTDAEAVAARLSAPAPVASEGW